MRLHLLALVGFRNNVHNPPPGVRMNSNAVNVGGGVNLAEDSLRNEYVHPDITKLLLVPASWGDADECPFVVDPTSLVLRLNPEGADKVTSSGFMPLHRLAYIAEQCECAVFGMKLQDRNEISGKILGLVCLSQLSSDWPDGHDNTALLLREDQSILGSDESSAVLVATMVSLNLLESSIRSVIRGFNSVENKQLTKVGAPLLRDMIETLSELDCDGNVYNREERLDFKCLATILRALLLPTRLRGINLRNLISHGFLSDIDRRWFALTLVLVQTLDSFLDFRETHPHLGRHSFNQHTASDLRKYPSMTKVVTRGQDILMNDIDTFLDKVAADFVPTSYRRLIQFIFRALQHGLDEKRCFESHPSLNTIFLIAASTLLEHSLRLKWCQANNRPSESIARPSKYYVTLDGHGQRDKHDVIVAPYLGDGSKNQFMLQLGPIAALVSDLYSAPSPEAPNIRSQLCHGNWDSEVIRELELLTQWYKQNSNGSFDNDKKTKEQESLGSSSSSSAYLVDAACAVTALLDMLAATFAGDKLVRYEPVYSYVAMWRRGLARSITNLSVLEQLISEDLIADCIRKMECKQFMEISNDLKAFKLDLDMLRLVQPKTFPAKETSDIWSEYDVNIRLSECIAAQTLLSEVSDAALKFTLYMQGATKVLNQQPTSTKEKRSLKTASRICGIASIAFDFYVLSVYVCLLMMHDTSRADIVKAVERTRMTLSTFDNYLDKNLDRSMKALAQYLQGKALQKVMQVNHLHSSVS